MFSDKKFEAKFLVDTLKINVLKNVGNFLQEEINRKNNEIKEIKRKIESYEKLIEIIEKLKIEVQELDNELKNESIKN